MTVETNFFNAVSPVFSGLFWYGEAKAKALYPHGVFRRVVTVPEVVLNQNAAIREKVRMQIDVYADDPKSARVLAESVKTALGNASFKNWPVSDVELYEPEVDKYRVSMDFGAFN